MLRYVDRGTAVLAANRQSLQHSENDEQYRRGETDALVTRKETNRRSGTAH